MSSRARSLSSVINASGVSLSSGISSIAGNIIPSADVTHSLGSITKQWKDVFVGPGSLYVNGSKVLEDVNDTITFTADIDQSIRIKTLGTGILQLGSSTTTLAVESTLQMLTGKRITDSAGIKVEFGNPIEMNSNKIIGLGTPTANTDAATKLYVDTAVSGISTSTISQGNSSVAVVDAGSGTVTVTVDGSTALTVNSTGVTVAGDFTVSGTTTTVNSNTINLADNIITLNSDATGSATQNAGIEVERGDDTNVQVRWDEGADKWKFTNDGATFYPMAASTDDLAEGSTNLYHTTTRVRAAISAGTGISITSGQIAIDSTVATLTGSQTLTNKTLTDSTTYFQDDADTTKKMQFQLSGITASNTRTLTVPDVSGTIALTGDKLSVFAATTSAELAGVISDETGSGLLVFATSPSFTTDIRTPKVTTSGATNLVLDTNTGTTSGSITIAAGANGNITLLPNGTGKVGIGNSSPRALLDFRQQNNGQVILLGENSNSNVRVGFGLDASTAGMRIFTLNASDQFVDIGGISSSDGSTWTRHSRIGVAGGNSWFNENGGKVGVGTNSPTSSLDILGLQTNSGSTSAQSPTGTLRVSYDGGAVANTYGASVVFSQRWWSSSTQQVATGQISGVKINSDGNFGGGLAFFYGPNGTNALSEGIRLANNGKVGIGTTSPTYTLTVNGDIGIPSNRTIFEGVWHTTSFDNLNGGYYPGFGTANVARHEIARITIDYNDWNNVGSTTIELSEGYYGQGGYSKWFVHYGYVQSYYVRLMEAQGNWSGASVSVGSPVQVSDDIYYLPVYVNVQGYYQFKAKLSSTRLWTDPNTTPSVQGYISVWTSPNLTNPNTTSVPLPDYVYTNWGTYANGAIGQNNYAFNLDNSGSKFVQIRGGKRTGTGTYSLFTRGDSSAQSSGKVYVQAIYGTPATAGSWEYVISGAKSISLIVSNVAIYSGSAPSIYWSNDTLYADNTNQSVYYSVIVELHDIGIGWSATWGDFPGFIS